MCSEPPWALCCSHLALEDDENDDDDVFIAIWAPGEASTVSCGSLSPTLTVGGMGCSAGQRGEKTRGRWIGHRAGQRVRARQSRSARKIWELYFLLLESILSPWVTTIQRWWRARTNREPGPRPAYAAMVVLRWW